MIKVCIFNESNDVLRFDVFKKFFECVNSKISLTCCTETDAVYQHVPGLSRYACFVSVAALPTNATHTTNLRIYRTTQGTTRNEVIIVSHCQSCFAFSLPSVLWSNRVDKFDFKYATCGGSFVGYGS